MNNRDPIIQRPPPMKNGRYFNFRDICDRNLWDTGYLVKKLQGYGILRSPLMGPHYLEQIQLAVKAGLELRASEFQVWRSNHSATLFSWVLHDAENRDVWVTSALTVPLVLCMPFRFSCQY